MPPALRLSALLILFSVTLLSTTASRNGNDSAPLPVSTVSQRVYSHSPAVAFYSTYGRRLFGYYDNRQEKSYVCAFRSGRSRWGGSSSVKYSLTVLHPSNASAALVSIRGRVARLQTPSQGAADSPRIVLACSVSYNVTSRNLSVTEWNVLILDPKADLAGRDAWLSSNYDGKELQASLKLSTANEAPLKSENNTVTCEVTVSPAAPQLAQLSVLLNGVQLSLLPTDLDFAWSADLNKLTIRAYATYLPDASNAVDDLECRAEDPLTLETATKKLQVTYKAGLSRVHLVNAATGKLITNESNIGNDDAISCQGDVAMPEVTYSWRIIRHSQLVTASGQNLSLKLVNLYYPVCCRGENLLSGRRYSEETCVSLRGNSTMHTVVLFDKDGRREASLVCGRRSTMGIMQVRYSELECSAMLANASRGLASADAAAAVAANKECSIHNCSSPTALGQVKRNCKKTDDGCHLDTTWLMDPFVKSAIKSKDIIPQSCFAFSGGLMRIEVDYFCTSPSSVEFEATGQGSSGRIARFFVPRSGCYEIIAAGASGGNHSTSYGASGPGSWQGGRGATMRGKFRLQRGLMLAIVVGQHGGNSSEISPSHRPSIEDNAGTGGGGGSFVYNPRSLELYVAAGGGGGASYTLNGVHGQSETNGTDSNGPNRMQSGRGGFDGGAGWTNTEAASYHGGCGAGWLSGGARRAGPEHGGAGHGGPLSGSATPFQGGQPGGMNGGAVGGFGGGGGGSEDNGASGGGGGYSGGGAGTHDKQAGGGGGSFCNATLAANNSCQGQTGGNAERTDGRVTIYYLVDKC